MDDRGQELSQLRDYGHKLLEMLNETLTHITDIADEYSDEAENWHGKYNECAEQNKRLQNQITNLTESGNRQNEKFIAGIDKQAAKIESMSRDFDQKINGLFSHRNQEIDEYGSKIQALIDTQSTLNKLIGEVKAEKQQLDENILYYNEKIDEYESKSKELKDQLESNQEKINEYQELFNFKLDSQKRIDDIQKTADDKEKEAQEAIADLTKKYDAEAALRQKLENELAELKNRLQDNNSSNGEEYTSQDSDIEHNEENQVSHDDDDEDGTK